MNKPTLEELCQPLNVDKTPEDLDDLCAEIGELKENLEEIKDERDELEDKLKNLELEIDSLIKHFQGYFCVDQALNSPMSEFYNDMEDMAKDVVKTLELLKSEI